MSEDLVNLFSSVGTDKSRKHYLMHFEEEQSKKATQFSCVAFSIANPFVLFLFEDNDVVFRDIIEGFIYFINNGCEIFV